MKIDWGQGQTVTAAPLFKVRAKFPAVGISWTSPPPPPEIRGLNFVSIQGDEVERVFVNVNSYPYKMSARKQRQLDSDCRSFNKDWEEQYFVESFGIYWESG
jgi:hypothetical protein